MRRHRCAYKAWCLCSLVVAAAKAADETAADETQTADEAMAE